MAESTKAKDTLLVKAGALTVHKKLREGVIGDKEFDQVESIVLGPSESIALSELTEEQTNSFRSSAAIHGVVYKIVSEDEAETYRESLQELAAADGGHEMVQSFSEQPSPSTLLAAR